MTVDSPPPSTADPEPGAAPETTSAAARQPDGPLEDYLAAMRGPRRIYAAVIVAVVAAIVVAVAVLWSGSEAAHTTLHRAAAAAPPVPSGTASDPLRQAWHSDDSTAIGTPYWIGTVVTYDAHTVRGRNGSTGAVAWSYSRSDRTVCQAIQDQGTTIAIYDHDGNCDEVTALDSGTGTRKWTRTLDKDGYPLNGHPTYAVSPITIMLTTPSVIYAFDPGSGLDRWTFSQQGCAIHDAALGTVGALISQSCSKPKCSGLKFCGAGPQLVMRDATAGRSDDDKDKANPDQIKWIRLGLDAAPASADQLVSAVNRSTQQLIIFDAGKGTSGAQLALRPAAAAAEITATPTQHAELLWIDGTTYAVNLQSQTLMWSTPTQHPPTLSEQGTQNLSDVPDLSTALIAAVNGSGIQVLAGSDGRVVHTYAINVGSAAQAYPYGTGFVVTGTPTTVYQ